MSDNIEREFKWDAKPRGAFERFEAMLPRAADQVSFLGRVRITDCYLDNEAGELAAQKIALRIRHVKAHWEVTLKNRSALKGGLATRTELTQTLQDVRTFNAALRALKKMKEWQGIDLTALEFTFAIRNFRKLYKVVYKDCVCEAALDDYTTLAYGHELKRREIELELKEGGEKDFEMLVRKLTQFSGLRAATLSKVAGAEKWISEKLVLPNFKK